jgi:PilZ domain
MNDPLKTDNSAVKRGMSRDSLLLKAILRFPKVNDEREVRIRNLSAGGLMAEVPVRVARGEPVEVNLRSIGWITGHVAWVTDGRIGIAFDHPINPKDARKPVSTTEIEMPNYLKKLNTPTGPNKLRRV